jgi:hypothetical protein
VAVRITAVVDRCSVGPATSLIYVSLAKDPTIVSMTLLCETEN